VRIGDHLVDPDQVRMDESRGRARFAHQPAPEILASHQLGPDELDRPLCSTGQLRGFPDHPDAALSDDAFEAVTPSQYGACHGQREWGYCHVRFALTRSLPGWRTLDSC